MYVNWITHKLYFKFKDGQKVFAFDLPRDGELHVAVYLYMGELVFL